MKVAFVSSCLMTRSFLDWSLNVSVRTGPPVGGRPYSTAQSLPALACAGSAPRTQRTVEHNICVQQYAIWPNIDQYVLEAAAAFSLAKLRRERPGLCSLQYLPAHACSARGAPPPPGHAAHGQAAADAAGRAHRRSARCHMPRPSRSVPWFPVLRALHPDVHLSLQVARSLSRPCRVASHRPCRVASHWMLSPPGFPWQQVSSRPTRHGGPDSCCHPTAATASTASAQSLALPRRVGQSVAKLTA
jgi:hypothetical protein